MKKTVFSVVFLAAIATVLAVNLTIPQRAASLAPLGFHWECDSRNCTFTRTTNNHSSYNYAFGDGSFSSCTTSGSANHTYSVGNGDYFFTVYFAGYGSSNCSTSPDNIVGCTVEVYNPAVGGFPGDTQGDCGP
jgi:hypothetical protein